MSKSLLASTPHSGYRADVDGLRALAVLSVVGFHAFPSLLRGGFVGVDVFFLISGFLISGLIFQELKQGRFSYGDFYARRIRRIFPALFTVLTTCLVVGLFWLYSTEFKQLGKEVAAGAGFVANILFWSESGYFDSAAQSKPLLHLWSLGVEEQFYIVWPLLVAYFYRRTRLLPWMIGSVLIASLGWNVHRVHSDPEGTFYLPMARFWELLLGALLAYQATFRGGIASLTASLTARIGASALSVLGIALIGASLVLIDESKAFPGWWALLPTLGTLLVIASPEAWLNRRLLANPAVVFIGLISYPLYLWHWVLLTAIARAGLDGRWDRLGAVAASFLLAWLTYRFIEKPIRFGPPRAARTAGVAAVTALAGVVGLLAFATDGAAFRYPPAVQTLAAFHYDGPRDYREDVCQLDHDEPFTALAAECVDPPLQGSRLLVLWGDSHASSLYQGLKAQALARNDLRLAQFTASGCPPLIGAGAFGLHKTCETFTNSALARIKELHPDIVLLEAYWSFYGSQDGQQRAMSGLQNTIRELQSAGVPRVVVFGSLPRWLIDQPTVGLRLWKDSHELKWRTTSYLDPGSAPIDDAVGRSVSGTSAIFVSPMKLLCNDEGCMTSVERDVQIPLAWDNVHLTAAGSRLLIELSSASIFGR